jgi:hypothetical protein
MSSLSIVISVYQSYEIVRRQVLYWQSLRLPSGVEIILVDDGSDPPIVPPGGLLNLQVLTTGNRLAWTQGLGRNTGVLAARNDYLLLTDIDHILSREAIEDAMSFNGPRMIFRRQIALLDASGNLTQDREALCAWGYIRQSLDASVHGNTFAMPRADFLNLGGYAPETCTRGYHPKSRQGDDCFFNAKWNKANRGVVTAMGRDIYLFPTGRFHHDSDLNPHGFFHNLHHREEKSFKHA